MIGKDRNKTPFYALFIAFMFMFFGCVTTHRGHLERANEFLLKKQPALAVEEFKKAIAEDSSDVQALYGLAYIYCDNEEWKKATPIIEKVARLKPNYMATNILLAKVYSHTDKLEDGLKAFPEGTDTTDANLLYAVGEELHKDGYFNKSLIYFQRICHDVKYYECYPHLAEIYCSKGEYLKAIDFLKRYLEVSNNVFERARLAIIYRSIDSLAAAEKEFKKTIAICDSFYYGKPKRPSYYWKGWTFYLWGDYENAIKVWELYKKEVPAYLPTYHNIYVCYLIEGNCVNWDKTFRKTIKSFPDEPPIHLGKGFEHLVQKEYSDALSEFRSILDKWPRSGVCNGFTAYTLEKLSRYNEAKRYWNLCILRVPGGVDFQDVHAFIEKMVNNVVKCRQTSENE